MDVIGSAISGLNAASKRLQASASNIANIQSTSRLENGVAVNEPYQPVGVNLQSASTGGVISNIQPLNIPPVQAFDPDSAFADEEGFVSLPDVNVGEEAINQILARNEYKANLRVLEAADDINGSLLDAFE